MMLRVPMSRHRVSKMILAQRVVNRGFHASAPLNEKTVKLIPTQVVVAAFTKVETAENVATSLLNEPEVGCHNLAIIKKTDEGKIKINEMGKIKKSHGAAVGALMAGTSAMLLGPVVVAAGATGGALAGAASSAITVGEGAAFGAAAAMEGTLLANIVATVSGAATGAYASSKIESLNVERMNKLGTILQNNQSALIAVFDQVALPKALLDEEDQPAGDEILSEIGRDISQTLADGKDVAYLVAVTEDEIVGMRMADGPKASDISGLLMEGEAVDNGSGDDVPREEIAYELVDEETNDKTK